MNEGRSDNRELHWGLIEIDRIVALEITEHYLPAPFRNTNDTKHSDILEGNYVSVVHGERLCHHRLYELSDFLESRLLRKRAEGRACTCTRDRAGIDMLDIVRLSR